MCLTLKTKLILNSKRTCLTYGRNILNLKFVNASQKSISRTHGDIEFRRMVSQTKGKFMYKYVQMIKYVANSDKKDW